MLYGFGKVCPSLVYVSLKLTSLRHLAPLHGIDFVTPSLIGLAAKKVFPHRITIALPARDRSLQYGSHVEAVKQYLDGLQPDDVIETVLEKVECPR
jgi:hypothetical protein